MTANQKRAAEIKLLEREIEVLEGVPDDAKFPVTVEQVRRISVKRVRDRAHRDFVRDRVARETEHGQERVIDKPKPETKAA